MYSRERRGTVWQTTDFESWRPAADVEAPERRKRGTGPDHDEGCESPTQFAPAGCMPPADSPIDPTTADLNWTNVTRSGATVNPRRPIERCGDIAARTPTRSSWRAQRLMAFVGWRRSWTGLNEGFPNLPVQRVLLPSRAGQLGPHCRRRFRISWRPGEGRRGIRPVTDPAAEAQLKSEASEPS